MARLTACRNGRHKSTDYFAFEISDFEFEIESRSEG